jgi:hypothetical protein
MSRIGAARTILLSLSAFMVWDSLSPATFATVFKGLLKNTIELSFVVVVLGSVVFLGIAVHGLVHHRNTVLRGVLNLLLSLCWCLVLLVCSVLMTARTGI